MKNVYSARDPSDAHLVRSLLESVGIRAVVQGESLWSVRGELPLTTDSSPSVWVATEDFQRARAIVEERESRESTIECGQCGCVLPHAFFDHCPQCQQPVSSPGVWICPDCGESIESQFTDCWRCSAPQETDGESRS